MSFQTHQTDGLIWLSSHLLDHPAIRHGFSTRVGGVSPAPWDSLNLAPGRGDTPQHVQENFRRFCAAVGVDCRRVVLSKQTHGSNIRLVTSSDAGKGLWSPRDYDSVDALICREPNLPLVVFSADCGTVLLHDPVQGAIGAVHAGWRGVASGLVYETVVQMQRQLGCQPSHITAALGPAIGPCCFETDDDVPAAMEAALGADAAPYMVRRGPKWHIDLKAINAHWLRQAGVTAIDICHHCTACHPELYWSHRKMGNARGGQVAMIALTGGVQ